MSVLLAGRNFMLRVIVDDGTIAEKKIDQCIRYDKFSSRCTKAIDLYERTKRVCYRIKG